MTTNNVSNLVAAQLSQAAYATAGVPSQGLPAGWEVAANYSNQGSIRGNLDPNNQFYTYINTTGSVPQVMIVFKGTNNIPNAVSDIANSGGQAWDSIHANANAALALIRLDLPTANIMTDGHSLGGGMAQSFALEHGLSGYGQNSLPISETAINQLIDSKNTTLDNMVDSWDNTNTFNEFNVAGDPATIYYSTLGRQFYLDKTPVTLANASIVSEAIAVLLAPKSLAFAVIAGFELYEAHSINTVVELLNVPSINYTNADGSVTTQYTDGTESTKVTNADNSSTTYFSSLNGDSFVINYAANQRVLNVTTRNGDGSGGFITTAVTSLGDKTIVHETVAGVTYQVETYSADPATGVKVNSIYNYDTVTEMLLNSTKTLTQTNGNQTIVATSQAGYQTIVHKTNGITDLVKTIAANGETEVLQYALNGTLFNNKATDAAGNVYRDIVYAPDGNVFTSSTYNGQTTKFTYSADGSVTSQYADGSVNYLYKNNFGGNTSTTKGFDGSLTQTSYRDQGNTQVATNAAYNKDGNGFTLTYRPDGSTERLVASNPDGTTDLREFGFDNSLTREIHYNNDGSSNESKYTLGGELYYARLNNGDGTQTETFNYADGSSKTRTTELDGKAKEETDDGFNNRVITILPTTDLTISNPDGSKVFFYTSDGTPNGQVTGRSTVLNYQQAGYVGYIVSYGQNGQINYMQKREYDDSGFVVVTGEGGYSGTFDANPTLLAQRIQSTGIASQTFSVGSDGLTSRNIVFSNGLVINSSYISNGRVGSMHTSTPDGTTTDVTYFPNGQQSSYNITLIDGSSTTTIYDLQGFYKRTERAANGSYVETVHGVKGDTVTNYDTNGVKISRETNSNFGLGRIEETFGAGGASNTTTTLPNGLILVSVDDGLGNKTATTIKYNDTKLNDYSDIRLSDEWSRADGASGSNTYSTEGISTGITKLASGAELSYNNDGAGNINYQYNFKAASVIEISQSDAVNGTLTLPANITIANLNISAIIGANGKPDLLITNNAGKSLIIDGGLDYSVNRFVFADGTILTLDQMMKQVATTPVTLTVGAERFIFDALRNDVVQSGVGKDTIYGWGSNKTYLINDSSDIVIVNDANGTIETGVNYSLADNAKNVRNITLTGSANLTVTGNDLDNIIIANTGNNTIIGGAGDDIVYGGTGLETVIMDLGMESDTFIDTTAQGAVIQLAGDLSLDHLFAVQDGNDLRLKIVGSLYDGLLVKNYFTNPQAVFSIKDSEGNTKTVQNVIDETLANPIIRSIAALQSDFMANARASAINQQAGGYQYTLQADGSYRSNINYNNLIGGYFGNVSVGYSGNLSVQHNIEYFDGRTETYTRAETWLSNPFENSISNKVFSIKNLASVQDSSIINISSTYIHDTYELKWAQSTANHLYLDTAINKTNKVLITDLQGNVIGVDNQVINSTDPYNRIYEWTANPLAYDYSYRSSDDPYWNTLIAPKLLKSPGHLLDTTTPSAIQIAVVQHNVDYSIQQVYVADGNHTVNADAGTIVNVGTGNNIINDAGFVYAGAGNNTITNAGIVYAGIGNNTIINATEAHGGIGDNIFISTNSVVGGTGDDAIYVGQEAANIEIDSINAGNDLVSGVGTNSMQILESYYQNLNVNDWRDRYEFGGQNLWRAATEAGSKTFLTSTEALQQLVDWDWGNYTLEDALNSGYITYSYIEPLPVVLLTFDSPVALSSFYASSNIPTSNVWANDYETVNAFNDLTLISNHTVTFTSDILASDLQLSWGQVMGSMSGLAGAPQSLHTALDITWGSGVHNLRLMVPHSNDLLGSGITKLIFSDGSELSMAELINLAPDAPSFDPHLPVFNLGMGLLTVAKTSDGIRFSNLIAPQDVKFSRDGTDLVISHNNANDVLKVTNWYADPQAMPEFYASFDQGSKLNAASITTLGLVLDGSAGNQVLVGLDGFANTFIAGPNSTFVGGSKFDTYLYNIGSGSVVINDTEGGNLLKFGAGITLDMIKLAPDGFTLNIGNNGDSISIANFNNYGLPDSNSIQRYMFANGDTFGISSLAEYASGLPNFLEGDEFNNELYGSALRTNHIVGLGGDDQLFGGILDDRLEGGDGNDELIGGAGSDTLIGGLDDDHYDVDSVGDIVIENLDEGYDEVSSSVTYTLGANIEDLYLSGNNVINGTGNDLDNYLYGNDASNILLGGVGNDGLDGGLGNDLLIGGLGDDGYNFNLGSGHDQIDNTAADNATAIDTLYLYDAAPTDVTLTRVINDLLITISASDSIAIKDYYLAADHKIDKVQFIIYDAITDTNITSTWDSATLQSMAGINTNYDPVVANPIAAQTAQEDSAFTFTIPTDAFTDADVGDTLTYTTTLANGDALPSWLIFDVATRTFTGTALNQNVGNLSLKVTATDIAGASASQNFDLTVQNTNDAPIVFNSVAAQTALEDAVFTFTLPANRFTDVDVADTLSYSATLADGNSLPSWLTFDAATSTFTGTPLNGHVGNLSLKVTATDIAGATASQNFDLTVQNTNDAPIVVNPIAAQTAPEDSIFTFTIPTDAFTDVDVGDTLNYTTTLANGDALPSWLTFDVATRTYTGTPLNQNVGNLSLKVTVTDIAGATASQSFDLTVQNTNDAPIVANAINAQTTLEDAAFTFTVPANTFTDVDVSDVLSYSATLANGDALPSWLTFNAATSTFTGTPLNDNVGNLSLKVIATDTSGASASQNFDLAVQNTNDAPTLSISLADTVATETQVFTYTIPSNSFADVDVGDVLTYSATLANGAALPSWLSFNAATRTISGTPLDANIGQLEIRVTATDIAGTSVQDNFLLTINPLNRNIVGTSGNDTLVGGQGNDTIDGGAGVDNMKGGKGNDTYIVDIATDVVVENLNEGIDTIQSSVTLTSLAANVENITLTGITAINGTGNTLNNVITGNSANNTLNGGVGADTLQGGLGNDIYVVDNVGDIIVENVGEGTDAVQSSITYTLGAEVENLTLTGTAAINGTGNDLSNSITGNTAANILTGGNSNDTLNGGAGADTLIGNAGNDTYVLDNLGDVVVENAGEGTDTVQTSITLTSLAANVENLTLTGTAAINGNGNALDNLLTGNATNNTLNGAEGNDTLNGAAGIDTLIGGLGNDVYVLDSTTDIITENANEGTDTVQSSVTQTSLAANVENITLTGTTAIDATGNALDNVLLGNAAINNLTGGAGNDTLNGAAGADNLIGGTGDDTYIVDNLADVVTENSNEGIDTIQTAITLTSLAANVENLIITGTAARNATGNELNNTLTGNVATNILDGGLGADTLIGGLGNDTYVIDDAGDVVIETSTLATELDTVQSSISYTLGQNLEKLTLTGTANINAVGNELNNTLTGNAGNNILDGGLGNDTMLGGLGDDTYIVDSATDVVTEAASAGIDSVQSSLATYTLSTNVENLTLTGTANIDATGNTLANTIIGNAGDNILSGGTGADALIGNQGNDTYIVDNIADTVSENDNQGFDTVKSSVTFSLSNFIENLNLTGTGSINGTGNALSNFLSGTTGNNILNGLAGSDILQGLAGNDTLTDTLDSNLYDAGAGTDILTAGTGNDLLIGGLVNDTITTGTGYDVIVFNKGDGADIINASTGADNTLSLGGNFAYSDLSLTKTGNNLIIKMGATDQITLKDWYLTSPTNKSVINLQVVAEAIQGFALGGADNLRNNKIENFNFTNLVAAFDAAGATANWQLTDARLTTHLQAGSDTAAIGGDLAYQYGKNSNLTGMGLMNAQSVISNASFGQTAQTLNNPSVWQAELVKLG